MTIQTVVTTHHVVVSPDGLLEDALARGMPRGACYLHEEDVTAFVSRRWKAAGISAAGRNSKARSFMIN